WHCCDVPRAPAAVTSACPSRRRRVRQGVRHLRRATLRRRRVIDPSVIDPLWAGRSRQTLPRRFPRARSGWIAIPPRCSETPLASSIPLRLVRERRAAPTFRIVRSTLEPVLLGAWPIIHVATSACRTSTTHDGLLAQGRTTASCSEPL